MSTIKVGTLLAADGSTTTQPSIPALETRMAKAWVNFNGVGSVAIRNSFNVSSITDTNTGNFFINLANNVAQPDYSVVASNNYVAAPYYTNRILDVGVTGFRLYLIRPLSGHADTSINTAVIFTS